MTRRELAIATNTANVKTAVKRLDHELRELEKKESLMGKDDKTKAKYEDLVKRTKRTLDALNEKADKAKILLTSLEQNNNMDFVTKEAESMEARTVVTFYEEFCCLFEQYRENDDPKILSDIRRLNIAASILLGQLDSNNLMNENVTELADKIANAMQVSEDVNEAMNPRKE